MATQKGLCPYCQNKRFERRIFQVNPEASTCFCPVCMKEVNPKLAIKGYQDHIDKLLSVADNTLFVTCDPTLAYQQYAAVLELEPQDVKALLGRILCLVYMGKVRKSYLGEASTLLENIQLKSVNLNDYVFSLKKINFALDEYHDALIKKLSFKGRYFDLDCLKLYLSHLYEIVKMKELILSQMKNVKKLNEFHQNDVLINMLSHDVEEKSDYLHSDLMILDGHKYRYERIYNGRVFVEDVKSRIDNRYNRYRVATLDEKEKNKKYIKDEIFKDYTKVVYANKVSLAVAIFVYLLSGGFTAAGVMLRNDQIIFISFIACAGALFAFATLILILHFYWRNILKKRKLRID